MWGFFPTIDVSNELIAILHGMKHRVGFPNDGETKRLKLNLLGIGMCQRRNQNMIVSSLHA